MAVYAAYRHIELDNIGYGKKRVLKPPGGGSSDIFGATEPQISARRVRNNLQSSLHLGASPPPPPPPMTAAANGDVTPRSKSDGNPVTGEGYTNGQSNCAGQAPASTANGVPQSAPAQRTRVPPGGFSSGLW